MDKFKKKDILKEYRKSKTNTSGDLLKKIMEISKAGQNMQPICIICDAKDLCISCDSRDWICASGDGWCVFEDGGDIVLNDPLY
jgi:hypothetical protein